MEIRKLKSELNDAKAWAEEKEGAALHWKLKYDDQCIELKDLQDKLELDMKG